MFPATTTAADENSFAWKLLLLLWIVKLFYPEVLIAYYIPALQVIRKLPTLLLILLFIIWISSAAEKTKGYSWLALFLFSLLLSSIDAENTGRARLAIRLVLEYYLLAMITLSYLNSPEKVQKIINLYICSIIYLSIWGIIGFLTKGRGIIVWDFLLNEEDAFGPLMCIGFALSSSLLFSGIDWQNKKKFLIMAMLLSMIGIILSLARGTFLVFLTITIINIKKSGNFLLGIFSLFFVISVTLTTSFVFFPDNAFWNEIKTVSEGTKSGTGRDRKVLWSIAWEEFKDNPILGVGPFNFGVVAGDYLHLVPDTEDYRTDTIWGRALHNGYLQILCEGGILGSFVFFMLIYDFLRNNRNTIKYFNNLGVNEFEGNQRKIAYLQSFHSAIIAFLLNAFFYDIIYYSWIFQLLLFNRLITVDYIKFIKN